MQITKSFRVIYILYVVVFIMARFGILLICTVVLVALVVEGEAWWGSREKVKEKVVEVKEKVSAHI